MVDPPQLSSDAVKRTKWSIVAGELAFFGFALFLLLYVALRRPRSKVKLPSIFGPRVKKSKLRKNAGPAE